jgi:hypothetical protein
LLHEPDRPDLLHELAAVVFPAFGAAISGRVAEQVVDEADLALCTWFLEHAVAKADHGFQRAMIGLDDVIEVFGSAMPDCVSKLALALQPADRPGI